MSCDLCESKVAVTKTVDLHLDNKGKFELCESCRTKVLFMIEGVQHELKKLKDPCDNCDDSSFCAAIEAYDECERRMEYLEKREEILT